MAMTAAVKDELARLDVTKVCCRKAEVSTLLRFGSALHIVSGRIVVEAELDTGAAARRLRKDIAEIYGHTSDLSVVSPSGIRKGNRYVVRVSNDGEKSGSNDCVHPWLTSLVGAWARVVPRMVTDSG